jgi:hypothetical protein
MGVYGDHEKEGESGRSADNWWECCGARANKSRLYKLAQDWRRGKRWTDRVGEVKEGR